MALGEVGFCGVVVWLGECILGRSVGNGVVVEERVGLDGAEVDLGGVEVVSHDVWVNSLG